MGVLSIVVTIQVVAIVLVALCQLLLIGGLPVGTDLAWGALAGIGGVTGASLMILGFRNASVGLVTPLSAVAAAGLPLLVSVVRGQIPSTLSLVGIAVGLVAVWLLSRGRGHHKSPASPLGAPLLNLRWGGAWILPERMGAREFLGPVFGLGSGAGYALAYLSYDQTTSASGLWPVLGSQSVIVTLAMLLIVVRRQRLRIPMRELRTLGMAGSATALGLTCFLLATRAGHVNDCGGHRVHVARGDDYPRHGPAEGTGDQRPASRVCPGVDCRSASGPQLSAPAVLRVLSLR